MSSRETSRPGMKLCTHSRPMPPVARSAHTMAIDLRDLNVKNGQKVKKGDVICSWDPFNNVIISEFKGTTKYEHVIEGITYREELEEQTGHREKVTIESRDKKKPSRHHLLPD